jgi:predicted membrane-bound spermidine synthase
MSQIKHRWWQEALIGAIVTSVLAALVWQLYVRDADRTSPNIVTVVGIAALVGAVWGACKTIRPIASFAVESARYALFGTLLGLLTGCGFSYVFCLFTSDTGQCIEKLFIVTAESGMIIGAVAGASIGSLVGIIFALSKHKNHPMYKEVNDSALDPFVSSDESSLICQHRSANDDCIQIPRQ